MFWVSKPKKCATFLGTPETRKIVSMGVAVVLAAAVVAIAAGVRYSHRLCCPAEIVVVAAIIATAAAVVSAVIVLVIPKIYVEVVAVTIGANEMFLQSLIMFLLAIDITVVAAFYAVVAFSLSWRHFSKSK